MSDQSELVQQSVAGGTAMKTGSTITFGGTFGVFLVEQATLISVIAVIVGLVVGVAGFIANRRDANARNRREEIEHDLRVGRLRAGGEL